MDNACHAETRRRGDAEDCSVKSLFSASPRLRVKREKPPPKIFLQADVTNGLMLQLI